MTSETEAAITAMNMLLHSNQDDHVVAETLFPYLQSSEYLIRSKAFAFLVFRPLPSLSEPLLTLLEKGEEREWELRALAALEALGDPSVVPRIRPLLFQRERPLLIRGALGVIAALGKAEAVEAIALLLLHPNRCYLKDPLLAAALAKLLASPEDAEMWEEKRCENQELAKAYRELMPLMEQKTQIGVYPFRDYLLMMARKQGLEDRVFQRAMYYRL